MSANHGLPVSWRKSSYSGASNGDCVEVADGLTDVLPVRDSKDPSGPSLTFTPDAWSTFLVGLKSGAFQAS
jgi:hypothetical protein